MIGQAILGKDLFSVPCPPAAEIGAARNGAATVLQKSMNLTKFKNPSSLLSSTPGSFKQSSIGGDGDLYDLRQEQVPALSACLCDFIQCNSEGWCNFAGRSQGQPDKEGGQDHRRPISKVMQLGVATVELELWQEHAEHISKICGDGGKR